MTVLEKVRQNIIPPEIKTIAQEERIALETLLDEIRHGRVAVPWNPRHTRLKPIGIGRRLRTKVNANIGTSPRACQIEDELKKLEICVRYGADTVMDLSTAGDLDKIRQMIIEHSPLPVGTVPIYQVMVEHPDPGEVRAHHILDTIRKHGEQGVDFITVHCGVTRDKIPLVKNRVGGVVSRGGSFMIKWMQQTGQENPLYEKYDELLDIAREYDMTLSLGDGLRPGAIADASDEAQLSELETIAELASLALNRGVQVMIEGPGHVPLHKIRENMEIQQKLCKGVPFYVLGPIVTDIAPGYDHITGAIGGALAAFYGAAFLCYVTPAEHLRLPTIEDVKEGIIAGRIAAHAADLALGKPGARDWDDEMSAYRYQLNWPKMISLAIDPEKAERYRKESHIQDDAPECSMCGEYCAVKISREVSELQK
jgi:phosphomethylpyrimidine synthase